MDAPIGGILCSDAFDDDVRRIIKFNEFGSHYVLGFRGVGWIELVAVGWWNRK
jgi:hypothetical protein